MSLGSRCNDPLTASYYSCPAACVVTDYDTQPGDDLCELHLPCTLRSLDGKATGVLRRTLKDELKDGTAGSWRGGFGAAARHPFPRDAVDPQLPQAAASSPRSRSTRGR